MDTRIDPGKVNLTEKDIEDWLYENPDSVKPGYGLWVDRWLARQFKVPSGIIDLIGLCQASSAAYLIIVEVKNTDITAAALTQVSRYAEDIKRICHRFTSNLGLSGNWSVLRLVVGPSVSTQMFAEASALDIAVNRFSVHLELYVSETYWTEDFLEKRNEQDKHVGQAGIFEEFSAIVEQLNEFEDARNEPDIDHYDPALEFEEAIKNVIAKRRAEQNETAEASDQG